MDSKIERAFITGVIVLLFAMVSYNSKLIGPQQLYANTPEKELIQYDCSMCKKLQKAYIAVIHRIWLDNPSYVEDVLFETDEMLEMDSLLNDNWDNAFEPWSKEDSVDYNTNWRYDPLCMEEPDLQSKPLIPDKKGKSVKPIVLK